MAMRPPVYRPGLGLTVGKAFDKLLAWFLSHGYAAHPLADRWGPHRERARYIRKEIYDSLRREAEEWKKTKDSWRVP